MPLALPDTAPLIRLTAGVGSAGQKTWNLRRPVTLLGSRRPAHIVLHDRDVTRAHCVIVNTGTDVLLKDLHTKRGTLCNNECVEGVVVLKDGDIVVIGATKLQIAIQARENGVDDSACGIEFSDPTRLKKPVNIRLGHAETRWRIEDAVALIGRHETAEIRLDHEDVSTRHAIIFRFGDGVAMFDTGSRNGVRIDGVRCASALLREIEHVTVGPCALVVSSKDLTHIQMPATAAAKPKVPSIGAHSKAVSTGASTTAQPGNGRKMDSVGPAAPTARMPLPSVASRPAAQDTRSPGEALADIESELSGLQKGIADSWDRLNAWQSRLVNDASKLTDKESGLRAREEELDAKDAALRGQLHDLTRYHEQITAREQELATQLARIQEKQDELLADQKAYADKEVQLRRQAEDIKRREHVLAQRWSRVTAATCSHCGKPVNTARTGGTEM